MEGIKGVAMSNLAQNESHPNRHSFVARRIATHRRRIIRILFVDDRKDDVELCLQELKRMDFAVSMDWVRVPAE